MSDPLFHMIAGAPTPVAPFSHAVEVDGWVFLKCGREMPFIQLVIVFVFRISTENRSPSTEKWVLQ